MSGWPTLLVFSWFVAALKSLLRLYHQPVPCQSFVPDLVTILNWPPEEWPYSALNWLVSRVNSATDSWMTGWVGPFTSSRLSSMPSTENPLNLGRVPPTEPPEPRTPPCCEVVPGAKTAYSLTSPPSVFTGNSFTTRPLQAAPSSEDSVWTSSEPADTSTTADTSPTSKIAAVSAVWLDCTAMPFEMDFLKPSFSMTTRYVPTSKLGNT